MATAFSDTAEFAGSLGLGAVVGMFGKFGMGGNFGMDGIDGNGGTAGASAFDTAEVAGRLGLGASAGIFGNGGTGGNFGLGGTDGIVGEAGASAVTPPSCPARKSGAAGFAGSLGIGISICAGMAGSFGEGVTGVTGFGKGGNGGAAARSDMAGSFGGDRAGAFARCVPPNFGSGGTLGGGSFGERGKSGKVGLPIGGTSTGSAIPLALATPDGGRGTAGGCGIGGTDGASWSTGTPASLKFGGRPSSLGSGDIGGNGGSTNFAPPASSFPFSSSAALPNPGIFGKGGKIAGGVLGSVTRVSLEACRAILNRRACGARLRTACHALLQLRDEANRHIATPTIAGEPTNFAHLLAALETSGTLDDARRSPRAGAASCVACWRGQQANACSVKSSMATCGRSHDNRRPAPFPRGLRTP